MKVLGRYLKSGKHNETLSLQEIIYIYIKTDLVALVVLVTQETKVEGA